MSQAKEKITALQEEQKDLVVKHCNEEDIWEMGVWLREEARKHCYAVGMSMSLNHKKVFHCTMPKTAPLSDDWLRRKENTVYKFFKSSYEMAYFLESQEQTVQGRYGLPHEDFAIAGGGVPITVEGVGVVGAIAVTGLSQEKDHQLAASALAYLKSKEI